MQMVYHTSKRTSLIRFWGPEVTGVNCKMIYSSHSQVSHKCVNYPRVK